MKKIKIDFFFFNFAKDVLISLLRGPKIMRKKNSVVFEKFEKFLKKFSKKRGFLILAKFFEKKNIPIFFCEYSKIRVKTYIMGVRNHYEKLSSSFRDMGQKKKVDRPSVPSHPIQSIPSIRQYKLAGRLVSRGWRSDGLSTVRARLGTVRARLGTARARLGTARARLGTARTRLGTVRARLGTVRARLGTARARLGYTLKGL